MTIKEKIRHCSGGEIIQDNNNFELKTPGNYSLTFDNKRDLLISSIYNNSTPEREQIVSTLRDEFGTSNVHIFGSQRTGEVDKFEILSRSVFNICFENSIEGYITEKLFHSKILSNLSIGVIQHLEMIFRLPMYLTS